MEIETIEKMSTSAFAGIQAAREVLFAAAEKTIEAKQKMDADKAAAYLAGKFDGKNAEAREAQARDYLTAQITDVELAEKNERRARFEFDRASFDLDTAKTLLRIAELTKV